MSFGKSPVELELPVESDNPERYNHFTADERRLRVPEGLPETVTKAFTI
jgi:hypothetical protein